MEMVDAIRLNAFGSFKHVDVEATPLEPPAPHEVIVRPLASPINPADLNIIQGRYGTLPPLPVTLGNEGVGEVTELGSRAVGLEVGDWVIAPELLGWWCEAFTALDFEFIKVPSTLDRFQAAALSVNPPSSWRMLHDYVALEQGDWVLQNCANSAVGRAVIEIARVKGWKTCSIVRKAEQIPELEALGADRVLLQDEFRAQNVKDLGCRLGLDGVGGPIVKEMAKALEPHSPMVIYGAMSKQPVEMGPGIMIFRDIRFLGFWRTHWMRQASPEEIAAMYDELIGFAERGLFQVHPKDTFRLSQAQEAFHSRGKRFFCRE